MLLKEREIFDTRGLVHIDPMPKTWELIEKNKYAEASDYLSYFMQFDYVKENPRAVELFNALQQKRNSYEYKQEKFIQGIIEGKSDENIGKVSAIASDFLVIGDVRDLVIEGNNYINNKRVDGVVVALSTLGLVATISTVNTFGTTSTVKGSISILKYAKKVNMIPNWLNRTIIKEAKVSKKTKSLNNIVGILEPIHTLYERVGLRQTLNLLYKTKNLNELKGVVKLSKKFGTRSSQLLKLTGIKSIKEISTLSKVAKPETILYASSYGKRGLIALQKLGEAKFLLRISKSTYKGNFDSIFTKLLNTIPTSLLLTIIFLALFYYFYKTVGFIKELSRVNEQWR